MATWISKLQIIDATINQVAPSGSLPVLADAVWYYRLGFLLSCGGLAAALPWASMPSMIGHGVLVALLTAVVDHSSLRR